MTTYTSNLTAVAAQDRSSPMSAITPTLPLRVLKARAALKVRLSTGMRSRTAISAVIDAGFIEPMLCLAVREVAEGAAWQYEIKLDGEPSGSAPRMAEEDTIEATHLGRL
jgi:hypothetical protein